MKLTYIANIRFPTERAHGIQIMSMAEAFAEAGAETSLLVSDRKTKITADPFEFYGVKNIFSITRLPTFDLTHYGHIFRALAYHVERITFTRSALKYARAHPDHVFFTRDELTFVRFSSKNIPIIYEMHTMPSRPEWYLKSFQKSKRIVVITEHLKKALIKIGVDDHKIIVAPDGVNLDAFKNAESKDAARDYLKLDKKDFIALYIGLFDEWKGYQILLQASSELKKSGVQTVLIGGTEKQVREVALKYPDAIVRSFIPYAKLPTVQQAADVLIIPNSAKFDISRLYTSPLKLFAHMTSQIPMVVSDLPSLREILNEETAVFFTPDSPASLTEAILKVKENPYKMKTVAEKALELVEEYSWQQRAKKILDSLS